MHKTMTEQIQRFKYLNGYALNESPKYTLVDGIEEDDVPDLMQNDNQEDSSNDIDNLAAGEDVPQPENPDDESSFEPQSTEPELSNVDLNVEPEENTPSPEELQNDIIRNNISVMKQLNQKIEDLENIAKNLSVQNLKIEKDVDEVREPTNVEKLVQRKDDSHPYYYGLNDMWKGNWFQARRDELNEKGIKKLEDGTYVADFDDLPKLSTHEIKDSFNEY